MTQYMHGVLVECPKCPGVITCSRCNTVAVNTTVRQSDSYGRHGLGSPNLQAVRFIYYPWLKMHRDRVGVPHLNRVGVHHLTYAWTVKRIDGHEFRVNSGMNARPQQNGDTGTK